MSDTPKIQKADSNLVVAERVEAKLRTALAKAGNLLELRKRQMTVALRQEEANSAEDGLNRARQKAAAKSECLTNAESQISTLEEQIADLQKQLCEAKKERENAENFVQWYGDLARDRATQLDLANSELEEAEQAAARAKEAVDAAPMTLMERIMARFAS